MSTEAESSQWRKFHQNDGISAAVGNIDNEIQELW